jgi:hypothetical protein
MIHMQLFAVLQLLSGINNSLCFEDIKYFVDRVFLALFREWHHQGKTVGCKSLKEESIATNSRAPNAFMDSYGQIKKISKAGLEPEFLPIFVNDWNVAFHHADRPLIQYRMFVIRGNLFRGVLLIGFVFSSSVIFIVVWSIVPSFHSTYLRVSS